MQERQTELAAYGLRRSNRRVPFEADVGLVWLLDELAEWLDDDRQWLSPYRDQWSMLLADLTKAHEAAGARLGAHLDERAEDWEEVASCKAALGRGRQNQPPDPSLRRRLRRATAELRLQVLAAAALEAAFEDLIETTDHLGAWRAAVGLRDLADAQGLESDRLVKSLADLLEDEVAAVKAARGEPLDHDDLRRSAGLSPEERVSLCRSRLRRTPRRVDAVVWLHYVLAPMRPGRIDLGGVVQIFSAGWLRDAIAAGEDLPVEMGEDPADSEVARLAGVGRERGDGREEVPEALIRVALGEVATDEAMQLARETAELVLSLAVLLGSDPTIWLPSESYDRYYDGRWSGGSSHAWPVRTLSLAHHDALESEEMVRFAEEWGETLPPHLPPRSPEMRQMARLALWLRRSRESWDPGRIVLGGRVLEQVAGWAGVADRHRFAREFLRLSWALRRIYLEIDNCWRAIWADHESFETALLPGAWAEVAAEPALGYEELPDGRHSFNRRGVLEKAEFLQERTKPGSAPFERLGRLREQTRDGRATLGWIKRLEKDFDTFAEREQRIRNALVHGGAVGEMLPESVVFFIDWLAGDALHAAIEGTLAGEDLVDHFLDYREEHEARRRRMSEGVTPSDALFDPPG